MEAAGNIPGRRSLCIAIQQDAYSLDPEKYDASSPRWAELLEKSGHQVKWVNVRHADILDQIQGCHGFMWRWGHFQGMGRIARRLLPVLERELGLLVYPDQNTCWHYDDKVAQAYLLPAAGLPVPRTWAWFDPTAARDWAGQASYPLVLKLSGGAGSTNVRLVRTADEARLWIDRLFSRRVVTLAEEQFQPMAWKRRFRAAIRALRDGVEPVLGDDGFEPQSGYALFQEFLPDNTFDTRVTVVGKRAFAFRRFNRPNDFRASGSGNVSTDPKQIDPEFIRLAFQSAKVLGTQSCAMDGLRRGHERVIGEISYTYISWIVHACPGHWELEGDPESGRLEWVPGQMWPEEAQMDVFLRQLAARWPDAEAQSKKLQADV